MIFVMDLYQDNKSKLLELLKRDRTLFKDDREKIMEEVEKMNEKNVGELLRNIVDGHYKLSEIGDRIANEKVESEKKDMSTEEDKKLDDYSNKGQIGSMRTINEKERKTGDEGLEIAPEDEN